MAPRNQGKAAGKAPPKRLGRPTKGPARAAPALAVRVTEADRDLINAIIADEQSRAHERGGMAPRPTIAGVIRPLVRQEAQRRGLTPAV